MTIKELQQFLGMVNNHRTFIKSAALHLYYLFNALKGKKKNKKTKKQNPCVLVWTPECQNSSETIKDALAKAIMLCHPRMFITADALKIAIGAVLEQQKPLGC